MGTAVGTDLSPAECDRLLGDERFLRRFAQEYRGDARPADALWWLAHPDQPGPSGAPSPGSALPQLRHRVYAPSAGAADVARLEAELARLVAERALALEALAATGPPPVASVDPPAPAVALARSVARLPRPPRRLVVAALAAVLVGAAGGAALGAVPTSPAPVPSVPAFTPAVNTRAALEVLERPARGADHPFALSGTELPDRSFRKLVDYPAVRATLFAARDRYGNICLVAADVFYRASCVDRATFRRDGVVLEWSAGPDFGDRHVVAQVAVWRPDGRVTVGPGRP